MHLVAHTHITLNSTHKGYQVYFPFNTLSLMESRFIPHFASPSIFSSALSRRKYAHTQNFLNFDIYISYILYIWHIFAKFHALRWLHSKLMAILGCSVARRIKFFLSKSLKTEYAIKSFLLKF